MTIKQKMAVKEITENHRSVSGAMKEVGYKPNTYSKPKNLTQSKAWTQLMEQYLPDDKLLEKHDQALDAVKQIGAQILIDKEGKVISKSNEGMIEVPDEQIRLKAVELGYRVKGKLKQEEGINLEAKIMVIPSELIEKYGITSNTKDSSER